MAAWPKKKLYHILSGSRRSAVKDGGTSSGLGEPAIWHAVQKISLLVHAIVELIRCIFKVLAETFPTNKFLMNGFILGVKGLLSFLSAPLIGALSDIWGRKFFLILTVFSTCMPIPLLTFSPWWYFALFSISGLFSATYSVVLAYVADITEKEQRNAAYGLVSATFGASLVTSPALGAFLSENLNNEVVVALATAIACLDVFFIMVAVPESLPAKLRHSWDRVTWEAADPFATLRKVGEDFTVMLLCVVVFLSYLPEAGQFSCFFVYLKLVVGFSPEGVAAYIGIVGVLSVAAQTGVLILLHKSLGCKKTILVGLLFQAAQLFWYGFGSQYW
uniref:Major facilitator superfamily (MFS) profile domain-containing protein n=1 Tax=Romanomermis culicivorax TaxID=13658 RepID=A0A915JFP7_ROMCU